MRIISQWIKILILENYWTEQLKMNLIQVGEGDLNQVGNWLFEVARKVSEGVKIVNPTLFKGSTLFK